MTDKPTPADAAPPVPANATAPPAAPRRAPGHRGADMRDTVAEMAERAQVISQEAGSKVAAAMKDVISAAAGIAGFAIESARDLVQYMVRRGQMTPEEAEKLIREAEAAYEKRPASEKGKPTASKIAADRAAAAKAEAAARAAAQAAAMPPHRPITPARPMVAPVAEAKPAAAPKPAAHSHPKAAAKPAKAAPHAKGHAKGTAKPAKARKPAKTAKAKAGAKKSRKR